MSKPTALLGFVLAFLAYQPRSAAQPAQEGLPPGTNVQRDLAYGPHERQKLDLFVPKSAAAVPLVIWIHGGGWEAGSKTSNLAIGLLAKGFAVASINYRYSQQAIFPAQIQDCRSAVRYLRKKAKEQGIDGQHIGVWGASAGGHLAALLGTGADVKELDGDQPSTESCAVQAVVNYFGPTDLAKLSPPGSPGNPVVKLLGGDTQRKAALAELANPITHIGKSTPPFLIFHGDADTLVPLNQSELLQSALKRAEVNSELVVLPKAGHGDPAFRNLMSGKKTMIEEFFAKHLKSK